MLGSGHSWLGLKNTNLHHLNDALLQKKKKKSQNDVLHK